MAKSNSKNRRAARRAKEQQNASGRASLSPTSLQPPVSDTKAIILDAFKVKELGKNNPRSIIPAPKPRKTDEMESIFSPPSPFHHRKQYVIINGPPLVKRLKAPVVHQEKYSFRVQDQDMERVFNELLTRWREETGGSSSPTVVLSHPAYLEIIGLGERVVPFILREMRERPGYWTTALKAITHLNPAEGMRGFKAATEKWVQWGIEEGLIE